MSPLSKMAAIILGLIFVLMMVATIFVPAPYARQLRFFVARPGGSVTLHRDSSVTGHRRGFSWRLD
jgi:hypothetical protein